MARHAPTKTPSEELLETLGPVERFYDYDALGDFGMPSGDYMEDMVAPVAAVAPASQLGPLEKVHAFWFAGMSCDGCTVSATGATAPSVESLILGAHPGLPRVVLHHPVVNVEAGPNYMRPHVEALTGDLDAPYVIILEGSVSDETKAIAGGGYWSGQGEQPWGPDGAERTVSTDEWVARLAPGAAASVAIGTCATWGGVPSAEGNPTGAMSLMDFLGKDYRSSFGVPVVNVPGCAPQGDNFTETIAAILYFLQGFGPLPEFDELGRPAWLFGETVHRNCTRGAYYEEGDFAEEFGDPECLVEVGCWGPVVNCNITSRGAINHVGGCMNVGGACIGCTMPGFPDKFTPFYKTPPGSTVSTNATRLVGSLIRPLRKFSNANLDRETRWDLHDDIPSGWAREKSEPNLLQDVGHRFYEALRRSTDTGKNRGGEFGKREGGEWTTRQAPPDDERVFAAEAQGPGQTGRGPGEGKGPGETSSTGSEQRRDDGES
jgi:hydrogenase small subunit